MPRLTRLIKEIHRRSLWQVLGIYLVGGWLAYEVILGLTEGGILPEWFPGVAVGLLVVGLPVVLATAFIQEGIPGPTGPESRSKAVTGTPDAGTRSPSRVYRLLSWRNALLAGGAVFAAASGLAVMATLVQPRSEVVEPASVPSVAVLPFANLTADSEDEYFADGVHDEILTQLFKISSLSVTSRTSVMAYKNRAVNLRTVAQELGVRYILEGTVRRFGDEVRITGQLIDAVRDVHIWSDSYTRDRRDLLEIQAEVAKRIALELQAELTPEEVARIDARPTGNPDAYDAYLRALDYNRSGYVAGREQRESDWRIALELYQRATERDSTFALAYADLGFTHLRLYWYGYDRTRERAEQGRRAIETALRLNPDLPQGHAYSGYYEYWIERDYDAAIRMFNRGLVGLPGDSDLRSLIGFVYRRQGRLQEAAREIERSVERDPLNGNLAEELGNTLRGLRRWEDGVRYLNRAIDLAPDYPEAYLRKIDLLVSWTGATDGARATLAEAETMTSPRDLVVTAVWLDILDRQWDRALARIAAFDGELLDDQYDFFPMPLLRAVVLELAGRPGEARTEYERTLRVLDSLEVEAADYRLPRARARTLAGLGRHEDALAAIRRALELIPLDIDAWAGPDLIEDHAYVLMRAGREADAIERLRFLIDNPSRSRITPALLRLDPRWDPLRRHSGFRALLDA